MSQSTEHKVKKRKHAQADPASGEPSSKRSKTAKAKDADANGGVPKVKKHKEVGSSSKTKESRKKDKGKATADGQFRIVKSTLALSIPPVFAGNLRAGAEEMLDSMVMRYVPALQGVMLAHDQLEFLESKATIKGDCPFSNCTVNFNSTVWSPRVGMKLVGKVNLCSPDHISLLVHRTFNVSIPRHHIPTDNWEFEYGPAENDPEFSADAPAAEDDANATSEVVTSNDRWVHKLTGERLGGESGELEFTVIGLNIANEMLSLLGSIQDEPFSAVHVPNETVTITTSQRRRRARTPVEADEDAIEVLEVNVDSNDENDDDPFLALGRITDADMAARKKERQEAEKKEKAEAKEKKRKRKEEKAAQRAAADATEPPEKKRKKKSKAD